VLFNNTLNSCPCLALLLPRQCDMCLAVSLQALCEETHFQSQAHACGICAVKLTLGQFLFLPVLRSSAVSIFSPILHGQFINHRKLLRRLILCFSQYFGLPLSVFLHPFYMASLLIVPSDCVVEFCVLKLFFPCCLVLLSSNSGVFFKDVM
jgi:hypothetical protein